MVHLKRRIFVLRVTSNANFIYTMEHKRLKILIQFLFVFCILTKAGTCSYRFTINFNFTINLLLVQDKLS